MPAEADSAAESSGNSICERCGGRFTCFGLKLRPCWCAELTLNEAARAELRHRYQRCLCRACLKHFAELGNPPTCPG